MHIKASKKHDVTSAVSAAGAVCTTDATDTADKADTARKAVVKSSVDVAVSENADSSVNSVDRSARGSGGVGIGNRFTEPRPIEIPPKLYRIGEVIEYSGLSRQTVHNYTTMGLLVEARRTDGGHRLYDESVFERLNGVIALKAQHKSLAYIREHYAKLDVG